MSEDHPEAGEPREYCARCGRPVVACYCAHVTQIPTRTRVVVLQHPRERNKAIGTARIAALCLPNAEIVVGFDFANDRHVRALLNNPDAPAVLLYPSPDARDLRVDPPRGAVTLVVLDGTWHHAKTLLRENPWLHAFPKVAFSPERPGEYRIRSEPREDYVSTIEALAQALAILEADAPGERAQPGTSDRFDALMVPFRAMVDIQLDYIARGSAPRKRKNRRHLAASASRLPPALLSSSLVCVMGEANAWFSDRSIGGPAYPHELVHLCATRLAPSTHADTQATMSFEHIVQPRFPLAASPTKHALLTEQQLRDGVTIETCIESGRQWINTDEDVRCICGHYTLGLLQREGMPLPTRIIDIRKVAGEYIKGSTGSAEDLIAKFDLAWQSQGQGRGGQRLGMLIAITQWLVNAART
jgi:DTW domain-containing protein YfiP